MVTSLRATGYVQNFQEVLETVVVVVVAAAAAGLWRRKRWWFWRTEPRATPKTLAVQVLVSGLPPTGSWQDLKDHMREAGDVLFTDVYKDGTGLVEFQLREDMKFAIKNLDDSKFRSHEVKYSITCLLFWSL